MTEIHDDAKALFAEHLDAESAAALPVFMERLFGETNNAVIEMRLIDVATKKARKEFFYVDAWLEAAMFGVMTEGFHVFLGLASRFDERSGEKVNCARLRTLWCDVDDPKWLMGQPKWPESVPRPSQIWASGGTSNGFTKMHLYWFLDGDGLGRDQFDDAEAVMRGIAAELHGDRNCTDVSRAMRMPGSLNCKYDPPVRVTLLRQTDAIYSFEDDLIGLKLKDPLLMEQRIWSKRRKEREGERQRHYKRMLTAEGDVTDPLDLIDPIGAMTAHCSLMRDCQATGGNLPEPLWYAALTNLAAFIKYGADPHPFSSGYPKYRPSETERKWSHACDTVARYGPIGCGRIAQEGGCSGCKYSGDVKSPAGIPYRVAAEERAARRAEARERQRNAKPAVHRIEDARAKAAAKVADKI